LCFIQQFDRFGRVNGSAIYIFFYSNLFGIVQQTTKRNMIAVPIFQFVPANAVPKFQLGAANVVSNFQFVAAIAVPNFEFGAANAAPNFQLGAANAVPNFRQNFKLPICHCKCSANLQ
jgi:hypothetical protein